MGTRGCAIVVGGSVVALALLLPSGAGADDGLKTSYLLASFVEETGDALGYGHYEDSTASSGRQCKGTFRVAEGKRFSITSTTIKGPNGKPEVVVVKDPSGAGSPVTPSTQSDGTGWTAVTHAADGMDNHDGTWSVYLPRVKGAKGLGCSGHERAVRVVFAASL
jgi:hypothetical protein